MPEDVLMSSPPTLDEVVRVLVDVWSEVLRTTVRPDSDLIATGATSLDAIVVAQRIADEYGENEELAVAALVAVFEAPTLLELAKRLHAAVAATSV